MAPRRLLALFFCALLLSGCSQAARTHTKDMGEVKAALMAQDYTGAVKDLEAKALEPGGGVKSGCETLYLLELGALYNYMGKFKESNTVLEDAYHRYLKIEEGAVVSASKVGTEIAKSTISTAVGDYELADFEKVYVHTIMALNYIMLKDPEGARVEMRRAYEVQKRIKDGLEAKVEKAKAEAEKGGKEVQANTSDMTAVYDQVKFTPEQDAMVSQLKNGYENAMTYVLSGMVYEINREQDDALIDYRQAYELNNGNFSVAKEFYRVAKARGSSRDTQPLAHRFSNLPQQGANYKPNMQVFVQVGSAPVKESFDLMLPNPIGKSLSKVSLPVYREQPTSIAVVEVYDGARMIGKATPLVNMDALAFRSFKDGLPVVYLQAVTRLAVATTRDYYLNKELGALGSVLGSIMSQVMESADVRCWNTLPKWVGYCSGRVAGQTLTVKVKDAQGAQLYEKQIPADPKTMNVINVRAFDTTADFKEVSL